MPAITVDQPVVDGSLSDGKFSGSISGVNASSGGIKAYPASSSFFSVPPVTAKLASGYSYNAPQVNKRIVYINGIGTNRNTHGHTVMLIAVLTGVHVVGIYNQSGDGSGTNIVFDLIQCLGDKTGLNGNPASKTLGKSIYDACISEKNLNIVAHSQGALIASRALRIGIGKLLDHFGKQNPQVRALMERKPPVFNPMAFTGGVNIQQIELEAALRTKILPEVERRLNSFVSVQTFGGAGTFFPNGPIYRHVNNGWDPVSNAFGQGAWIHGGGRGAQEVQIERNSGMRIRDIADHSIDSLYLQPSDYYIDRNGRKVDSGYVPIDMTMIRGTDS